MQEQETTQFKLDIDQWPEQRLSMGGRELFGWWQISPQANSFVEKRAHNLGIVLEPTTQLLTGRFLTQVVENSPMPPIHIEEFVDQILISQASNGEIPVTVQAIACLNYFFNPDTQLEHVLPIDERTKRWERFTEELGDFLLGITELGARPVLIFGISDVLDFEDETTYAHTSQELRDLIEQNVSAMSSAVQVAVENLPVPDKTVQPQVRVFRHSQTLAEHPLQTTHQRFTEQLQQGTTIEAFRIWLQDAFGEEFPYLLRLDPLHHHRQLLQMMALYAADNTMALQNAKAIFPHENIQTVTSLSLQPTHAPEWIAEKVACAAVGVPLIQLTPFRNAGKWWIKRQEPSKFSLQTSQRIDREDIFKQGPAGVVQKLRRLPDSVLLPDINTQGLSNDTIFSLRDLRIRKIAISLLGGDITQEVLTRQESRVRRQVL